MREPMSPHGMAGVLGDELQAPTAARRQEQTITRVERLKVDEDRSSNVQLPSIDICFCNLRRL